MDGVLFFDRIWASLSLKQGQIAKQGDAFER
jgi:hypothetical protein